MPFSCAESRNKDAGLGAKAAKSLLLYKYNCDLTEVNKKRKRELLAERAQAELLAWMEAEEIERHEPAVAAVESRGAS